MNDMFQFGLVRCCCRVSVYSRHVSRGDFPRQFKIPLEFFNLCSKIVDFFTELLACRVGKRLLYAVA